MTSILEGGRGLGYRKSMATLNGHSMPKISSQETKTLSNDCNKMPFDDLETLQISYKVWTKHCPFIDSRHGMGLLVHERHDFR